MALASFSRVKKRVIQLLGANNSDYVDYVDGQMGAFPYDQELIDAALEANANEVDVDDVHSIYRLVLIEVLALSYAVKAPPMWTAPTSEFTA